MTGIGDIEWWEMEQDENRGQEMPPPRKAWNQGKLNDENNEDGNSQP